MFCKELSILIATVLLFGCEKRAFNFEFTASHREFLAKTRGVDVDLDSLAHELSYKQAAYPYYVPSDGCSGHVTERGKKRFYAACVLHDVCYRVGDVSRAKCDTVFLDAMEKKCDALALVVQPACYVEARMMYAAVRVWSEDIYESRHRKQQAYERAVLVALADTGTARAFAMSDKPKNNAR